MKKINEQSLEAISSSAKMRVTMPSIARNAGDIFVMESLVQNMNQAEVPAAGTFYAQTAFTAIYAKVSGQIKNLYNDLDTIKNFYITRVILDQVVDDTLSPTVGSDEVFKYSHKNPAVQKRLDHLVEKLALNKLVQNIAHDLCFYGNYPLSTRLDYPKTVDAKKSISGKEYVAQPTGLKELKDNLEFGSLIRIDLGANDYAYLHQEEETGILKYHDRSDFVMFSLGGARIKARTDLWAPTLRHITDPKVQEYLDKIPKYVRIGKPYFYQMTDKLRELELLEKLVPAVKINKLTQGNLMSVRLPETYDLQTGTIVANKLEQLINRKVSVDPVTGQITVEAILQSAGRTRVVPQFGEKGTIDKFDTKADAVDDIQGQATELKNSILDSMGIPSELVYKSESTNKNDIIKRYSKYLRKLKQLQKALADGLKQIAYIDLQAAGLVNVRYDEIEVNFINALIEIDHLDKLEFTASTVNTLKDVVDFFVNNLGGEGSPFKPMINLNKVAEWLDTQLKSVGLSDVINTQKEGGHLAEPPPTTPAEPSDDTSAVPDDNGNGGVDIETDTNTQPSEPVSLETPKAEDNLDDEDNLRISNEPTEDDAGIKNPLDDEDTEDDEENQKKLIKQKDEITD